MLMPKTTMYEYCSPIFFSTKSGFLEDLNNLNDNESHVHVVRTEFSILALCLLIVSLAYSLSAQQDCVRQSCHFFFFRRMASLILGFISFATAEKTGTATELPNCLYACMSETGILKVDFPGSSYPISLEHSRGEASRSVFGLLSYRNLYLG